MRKVDHYSVEYLNAENMARMVDHYMVEHLDDADNVAFANDTPLSDLTKAKALAARTSKQCDTGAYVVAFTADPDAEGHFVAVGHISFFDGKQCETDGTVL